MNPHYKSSFYPLNYCSSGKNRPHTFVFINALIAAPAPKNVSGIYFNSISDNENALSS